MWTILLSYWNKMIELNACCASILFHHHQHHHLNFYSCSESSHHFIKIGRYLDDVREYDCAENNKNKFKNALDNPRWSRLNRISFASWRVSEFEFWLLWIWRGCKKGKHDEQTERRLFYFIFFFALVLFFTYFSSVFFFSVFVGSSRYSASLCPKKSKIKKKL